MNLFDKNQCSCDKSSRIKNFFDLTITARRKKVVSDVLPYDPLKVFVVAVTEKTRKTVKCELNVPYGPTERAKYDVYGTDLPKGT